MEKVESRLDETNILQRSTGRGRGRHHKEGKTRREKGNKEEGH